MNQIGFKASLTPNKMWLCEWDRQIKNYAVEFILLENSVGKWIFIPAKE
tara:strand:- start:1243 stop:1389 length:147 start_codon:yes stop_codon:yes gene_type:complete